MTRHISIVQMVYKYHIVVAACERAQLLTVTSICNTSCGGEREEGVGT